MGFTALWLPPANKAANIGGPSMGYDPYDYYDLGDINQKGSTKTWFGSKDELLDLIQAAHDHKLQVYADMVINHCNGGDGHELNPLDHKERWTKINYPAASSGVSSWSSASTFAASGGE
ncbi:MAG: alpha-amylase family glycosyl hydrolase [Candidatus Zixiibacteriota bacterium]